MPLAHSTWIVETTLPEREDADAFAREAIKGRLAACALVNPLVSSHYWWKGTLEYEQERLVVFKTTTTRLQELVAWIKKRHPYEIPYVGTGEVKVTLEYQRWMESETRPTPAGHGARKPKANR